MGSGKKRNLSVFDAIQELESEDVRTESRQRKKSSAQANRAQAAQSQTKIYNHLLECRILLQRAMTATTPAEEEEDGSIIVDSCNDLLENLLQARQQLTTGEAVEEDNENEYSTMVRSDSSTELQESLQQEYETCRDEWKQVLDRRHKDLKLHAGLTAKSQFRVLDSSFWEQVDATVEYDQLRRQSKDGEDDDEDRLDDSKVYQQLLKDFVAQSTATASGEGVGRLQVGKSSQNKKKKVDRRASKGRKIRYKEIPKLVNFTFPLSKPNSSNLNQDEWFQSLFGGVGKM
jgi:hypothetical protein